MKRGGKKANQRGQTGKHSQQQIPWINTWLRIGPCRSAEAKKKGEEESPGNLYKLGKKL